MPDVRDGRTLYLFRGELMPYREIVSECPHCGKTYSHSGAYKPATCGRFGCLYKQLRGVWPNQPTDAKTTFYGAKAITPGGGAAPAPPPPAPSSGEGGGA